ncbi:MAG TPA: hypothetical protein VFL60_05920 [Gaiellaceae bacterium]|nr:hypothetical protein [Gaiellaceae bacterium]
MLAAALVALALAAPPVTHDVLPVFVPPAGTTSASGVDYQYTWGGSTPLGIPPLGVFDRPRRARDVLPAPARTFARFAHGEARRSRLLIAADGASVYAFPKAGGQLCVVREPNGGGTCVSSFVHGAYPQVEPRREVWGVVDDAATSVDVTVDGRVLHAALGRNAFYLALPHGAVVPTRIVVHERGGVRHVYVVKRLGPA